MTNSAPQDSRVRATLSLLEQVFGSYGERDFAIRLWEGSQLPSQNGQPARFTLVLKQADSLYRMLTPPSKRAVAEAYVRGDIDIEGDPMAALDVIREVSRGIGVSDLVRVLPSVRKLRASKNGQHAFDAPKLRGRRHSKDRDKNAIRFHYDITTEFYELWLDQRMLYTCSYFPTGQETLDESQLLKLNHICRKLRLQPGETLLDLGCGWGGLVMHAAEHYGVKARGVTISKAQGEYAQRKIRERGLEDRCRVDIMDYRDVEPGQQYDKISAVGIIEHVGENRIDAFFELVWSLLKPGSVFYNQNITWHGANTRLQRMRDRLPFRKNFIQRHIFPDLDLLPIQVVLDAAGKAGWEVRDVESLREHYGITCMKWYENLNNNWEAAVEEVGEATARMFRAYLIYSAHSFFVGDLSLFQTIFAKPDANGRVDIPASRDYIYPR